MIKLSDLHTSVRKAIAKHVPKSEDEQKTSLDAISKAISKRRDEAKSARASSGIETTWTECEEAYIGIDDENRHEFQGARWAKPMSVDGPVTTGRKPNKDNKATAFVRLTARYVDAGSSKLGEILLPVDDKAFTFSETPVPELVKAKDDHSQVVHDGMGNMPLMRPALPTELPSPGAGGPPPAPASAPGAPAMGAVPPAGAAPLPGIGDNGGPPMVPLRVKDLAQEAIDIAHKKAKAAEKRIYDWHIECQAQAELRKVIFDSARIGVGVFKGPFPQVTKGIAVTKGLHGIEVQLKQSIKPFSKWVDPWNIFPDPSCGENIHKGDWIFERDHLARSQVEELKDLPGYIASQIDIVLEEGPKVSEDDPNPRTRGESKTKGRFEVWYFYGFLKSEDMDCVCVAAGKDATGVNKKQIYAIVTLINSTVVRATINPLESGSFPYHSHPWQRRAGHWAGMGVAEQVRMPQRMINSATRAMLNNAGISAGGQIIIDRSQIIPANGDWVLTPNKFWYKTMDSPGDDVNKAFTIVEIPNETQNLMRINEYALKLAEESSSIPLITQGQTGPTTPETLGATQLQNNNANQLLRSIGYAFDDFITEPWVRQYYEWLLIDPDVPDEEKGDFTINAHGSAALVERAIQDQSIAQMAAMVKDPAYGCDPRKWAKLFLQTKRINPEDIQYTEEQLQKIDAQPPPKAPAVQVAEIAADVKTKELVVKQTVEERTAQNEVAIATAARELESGKIQAEERRTLTESTIELHQIQHERELALLKYANDHKMKLEDVHASLLKTAMTLDTERQLNATDNLVNVHKERIRGAKPPAQLPGKASNGRAFEQGPPA